MTTNRTKLPMICICQPDGKAYAAKARARFDDVNPGTQEFLFRMAGALSDFRAEIHHIAVDQWCGVTVQVYDDPEYDPDDDEEDMKVREIYVECDRPEDGLVAIWGHLHDAQS